MICKDYLFLVFFFALEDVKLYSVSVTDGFQPEIKGNIDEYKSRNIKETLVSINQ